MSENPQGERMERLMTVKQVAQSLGVCVAMVWKLLREEHGFPRPITIGQRSRRWVWSDVTEYIRRKREALKSD